jgi:hypothetical protein
MNIELETNAAGGASNLFDEKFADLCSHLAHLLHQATLPHLVVDRSLMRLRLLDTESSRGGVAIQVGCPRAHGGEGVAGRAVNCARSSAIRAVTREVFG